MADVELKTNIKSDYVSLVIEALTYYGGHTLQIESMAEPESIMTYDVPTKGAGSNKALGQKILKQYLLNIVKMYKKKQDVIRYNTEVDSVTRPEHGVSNDIIED